MILELIKLAALPVLVGGALVGADVSALSDAYASTPSFQQVGQHGVGKDSAAEIVASDGADLLVYSNSEKGSVDFVNIADPSAPVADGSIGVGGEPTSVAITNGTVFVAVNTSESYTNPSGKLVVIYINTRNVIEEIALAGQPDSIAIDPYDRFVAIAIENERNEDINDALIPQYPAGNLAIVTGSEVKYVDLR